LAGLFGPAKTAAYTADRLNAAVREALETREVTAGLQKLGLESAGCSPAEFALLISIDSEWWGADRAGIRIQPGRVSSLVAGLAKRSPGQRGGSIGLHARSLRRAY
jgi:hypothetical protein